MGAYDRVVYHGHRLNRRTMSMLKQAEDYLGYQLTIEQGSYNAGRVSASAGTHDGGGAVDLAPADADNKVKVLRQVGFAAWHRHTLPGVWSEHIHCIAIGDREASWGARKQVSDYYAHLDGLAGHRHDSAWRPTHIVSFHYPLRYVDASNVFHNAGTKHAAPHGGTKRVQRALNLKTGAGLPLDGVWGPATEAVFHRYEKQVGGSRKHALKRLGLALYRVKD